jgi:hypothetical protein
MNNNVVDVYWFLFVDEDIVELSVEELEELDRVEKEWESKVIDI